MRLLLINLNKKILGRRDGLGMEWNESKQQKIMKFSLDLSDIESLAHFDENIQQKAEILKHIY